MSLLLSFLLLVQTAPVDEEEIVVIGKRLDAVAVNVGRGPDGNWYCSMDGTSGVASLDAKVCKAVTKCVRKGATKNDAVKGCIQKSKKQLFAKFQRERAKRR
jgi:hypothetical protein